MSHSAPARPLKSRQTGPSGNPEYSRKDKSLGLLCENFVQEFGRVENQRISLDAAASTLGVERRRIYDIVNVLESVGIVSRQAKNCYAWRGFTQIHAKLDDLKQKARSDLYGTPDDFRAPTQPTNNPNNSNSTAQQNKQNPNDHATSCQPNRNNVPSSSGLTSTANAIDKPAYVSSSMETEPDMDMRNNSNPNATPTPATMPASTASANTIVNNSSTTSIPLSATNNLTTSTFNRPTSRKEKSLGVLSQRFVQLFLLAGTTAVSLENAAIQLLGRSPSDSEPLAINPLEGADASKLLKTKVRRLYDIANILTSLNLIEKVHTVNRKPAFKWLGPEASCSAIRALRNSEHGKRSFTAAAMEERGRGGMKRRRNNSGSAYHGMGDMYGGSGRGMRLRDEDGDVGFDAETKRKIDCVIRSFPETYAKRWRDYVASVNDMMTRGQVSRDKAYESIANVLKQYRGDDEEEEDDDDLRQHPRHHDSDRGMGLYGRERERDNEPDRDPDHHRTASVVSNESGISHLANGSGRTTNEGFDQSRRGSGSAGSASSGGDDQMNGSGNVYRTGFVKKEAVLEVANDIPAGSGRNDNKLNSKLSQEERLVDNDSKERARYSNGSGVSKKEEETLEQNPARSTNGEGCETNVDGEKTDAENITDDVATTAAGSSTPPKGMTWTQDSIDLYMRRAKAAGPDYEKAAQRWLHDLKNWQKLWAGSFAALTMPQQNGNATTTTTTTTTTNDTTSPAEANNSTMDPSSNATAHNDNATTTATTTTNEAPPTTGANNSSTGPSTNSTVQNGNATTTTKNTNTTSNDTTPIVSVEGNNSIVGPSSNGPL